MRLAVGQNKFRALSSAITGYEYFNSESRPVRSQEPFDETPGIKPGNKVKHFWSFVVWNYGAKRVQILEIVQKSVQDQILGYVKNADWGDPKDYDITIIREGTGLNDTSYQVQPSPHKPVEREIEETFKKMKIDLELLFVGGDPFNPEK